MSDARPRDTQPRCSHEILCAYVDGELEPDQVGELEAHLADCRDCVELLRAHQMIKNLLKRSCHAEAAPSRLRERVMTAIMAQCRGEADSRTHLRVNATRTTVSGGDGSGILVRRTTFSGTVVRTSYQREAAPAEDDEGADPVTRSIDDPPTS